jgi:hypothetical protein
LFAVLGVLLACATRAQVAYGGTTPIVFADAVGDQHNLGSEYPTAPDIQSITVSDAGGVVGVTIHAPGFTVDSEGRALVAFVVYPQTSELGYYFSSHRAYEVAPYVLFKQCDATAHCVDMTPSSTLGYLENGDDYTFTFSSADVGGATAFEFGVYTERDAFVPNADIVKMVSNDWAPQEDWFSYELTAVAPPVEAVTPPAEPVAPPVEPVTPPAEPVTPTSVESTPAAPAGEPRPITELPDGAMYLYTGDQYHQISPAQFSSFGLSVQAIKYVGELFEPVGTPATDEQVTAMKADYIKTLTEMGVDMTVVKIESTPAATTAATPSALVEKPVISFPVTVPTVPTAGKVFTVSFPVTGSATGAKLMSATMICDPSVKGKVIKHFEQFKNGNATLRFTIPATARGKALKVHLKMVLGDQSTTRIATFLVH